MIKTKFGGVIMVSVLFRTVIIYVSLIVVMRIMGKRQVGELEITDLITTFLISEIASLPITETSMPISHAIVPIVTLLALEVTLSALLSRFPRFKDLLSSHPTTLIKDGEISQSAMREARLSFDELMGELRAQGADDLSQIKYAILEQNGRMTVIQKARFRQPTAEDLHLKPKETGLFHVVIEQGVPNKHGLSRLGLTRRSLEKTLARKGLLIKDVYIMMINDAGEVKIIQKEQRK